MADDLEAFLRQAAQRRVQRQKQAGRPPAAPRRPEPDLIIEPDLVIEAGPVATERLSTSDIRDHADHLGSETLGDEVGLADEKLETRLHQQFDHSIGSLKGSQLPLPETVGQSDDRPILETADLVDFLRNPMSLRLAIVLREILARPTDRW